jgi:transcriptional regulator with XRE-family HTH domain
MQRIGTKIKKIREIKDIPAKHMADVLDLSLAGYLKIERNEVDVNIEKLAKMAEALGMKPEDVMAFDEKVVFNHSTLHSCATLNYGHINYQFPDELKQLYLDKIALMAEKIRFLEAEIDRLKG